MFRRFGSSMHPSSSPARAPEFPAGLTWLNTDRPLSLAELRGHVVVLDFWTYCCINCMHVLPDLEWIEEKYRGRPVVVIGVHSAKFYNEQEAENIQEAIGRYEIGHPVLVDSRDMAVWRSYRVSGWPTIAVIDPKGNVVYQESGEGQRENLDDVISVLLERHARAGTLADKPAQFSQAAVQKNEEKAGAGGGRRRRTLSYPGKIAFSPGGRMLAVSDSNHNRILIVDPDTGRIINKVGDGARGLRDGGLSDARFLRPQGLAWTGEGRLCVADTENHALREVDLQAGTVRTLAGDGTQGRWVGPAMVEGRSARPSSPWDLAYDADSGLVFIAMAGLHQIWAYHLQSGRTGPFAGSGYEGIADGPLEEAQFAQPSGLALSGGHDNHNHHYLFVADSEVSAIRRIDLEKRVVETVVGEGLFVFGHRDGTLEQARLQHPLGVYACEADGTIYVADTYNHAIRRIDHGAQKVSTMVGKADMNKTVCNIDDPACDTLGLFEPGDVKARGRRGSEDDTKSTNMLYIADTNNHLVRTFDLDRKVLGTLLIKED